VSSWLGVCARNHLCQMAARACSSAGSPVGLASGAAAAVVTARLAGRVGARVSGLLSVLFLHPLRLVVAALPIAAFPPLTSRPLLVGRTLLARLGDLLPRLVAGSWSHSRCSFMARSGRATCTPSAPVAANGFTTEMAVWLQDHLPAQCCRRAMQTSGALFYYTNFTVIRWEFDSSRRFPTDRRSLHSRQSGPSTRPSSPSKSTMRNGRHSQNICPAVGHRSVPCVM